MITDKDIKKISGLYHAWRGEKVLDEKGKPIKYEDIAGFCKSATLAEVEKNGFVLTPGRYVGSEAEEDDGEPFEDKMRRLTKELAREFEESKKLEVEIKRNLEGLGWSLK